MPLHRGHTESVVSRLLQQDLSLDRSRQVVDRGSLVNEVRINTVTQGQLSPDLAHALHMIAEASRQRPQPRFDFQGQFFHQGVTDDSPTTPSNIRWGHGNEGLCHGSEELTCQQVKVKMRDLLAGVLPLVDNEPVPGVTDALALGHLRRDHE